jgi:antitoxin VapB
MNTPHTSKPRRPRQVLETTVFQSGNSQAIRIPKEFQFFTKRVEMVRKGQTLVLRPMTMTAAEAIADLPPLSQAEALALDQAMAQVDDLLALDEPSDHPPQPKATTKRPAR